MRLLLIVTTRRGDTIGASSFPYPLSLTHLRIQNHNRSQQVCAAIKQLSAHSIDPPPRPRPHATNGQKKSTGTSTSFRTDRRARATLHLTIPIFTIRYHHLPLLQAPRTHARSQIPHLPIIRIIVFLNRKRIWQWHLTRHAVLIHVAQVFVLKPICTKIPQVSLGALLKPDGSQKFHCQRRNTSNNPAMNVLTIKSGPRLGI